AFTASTSYQRVAPHDATSRTSSGYSRIEHVPGVVPMMRFAAASLKWRLEDRTLHNLGNVDKTPALSATATPRAMALIHEEPHRIAMNPIVMGFDDTKLSAIAELNQAFAGNREPKQFVN